MNKESTALEEVRKEVALRDKLMSIIAHDTINLFNQVSGGLELLESKLSVREQDKTLSILHMVQRSVEQVNSIFSSMLLWSRINSGKVTFQPITLSLNEEFEKVKTRLLLAGNLKNISINNLLDEEILLIADPNLLSCILTNLLYNAIKFTPKGGSITLNGKCHNNNTIISVADTGVGMTIRNNIIPDRSTQGTLDETGYGMGLIICREFAEMHKGKIEIKSKINEGTEVMVSLPSLK